MASPRRAGNVSRFHRGSQALWRLAMDAGERCGAKLQTMSVPALGLARRRADRVDHKTSVALLRAHPLQEPEHDAAETIVTIAGDHVMRAGQFATFGVWN